MRLIHKQVEVPTNENGHVSPGDRPRSHLGVFHPPGSDHGFLKPVFYRTPGGEGVPLVAKSSLI